MLNLIYLPIPDINRKKIPDKQQKSQLSLLFKPIWCYSFEYTQHGWGSICNYPNVS